MNANPPVEVEVVTPPFDVIVLTEVEVVVTVVRLAGGVTVLIGVVVDFCTAVRKAVTL